jgi:hypothetical protein
MNPRVACLGVATALLSACSSSSNGGSNRDGGTSSGSSGGGSGSSSSSSGSGSSSGGDSGGTVTGTFAGQPKFEPGTQLGYSGTIGNGAYVSEVFMASAEIPNACAIANENVAFSSTQTLLFGVELTTPIATGQAYQVSTQVGGTGSYSATNATCGTADTENASGGTITFTTISASIIAGTVSLAFPNGDSATGSFSVPVCAALGMIATPDGAAPKCVSP